MATLSKPLRNMLEKTVKEARERAEAGAQAALTALAVPHREPFAHLSPDERDLRNRLRAHARQLGDRRHATTGEHDIHHLVAECAYEHWHRMLFARFLAENHLLLHPQMGVAVTLEECAELAPEEGAANAWELAGRYASRMLPQIFRPDHPGLQLALAPEHQQELERLLAALPQEVFTADDSLGWVYQFWQSKRKEEINKSEVKIGAEELPAMTQLFTEPYMVQFLLHNSLGAWWAGRRLRAEDFRQAGSEAELREKCGVMGVGWEYLRFVRTSPPGPLSMNGEGEIDSEEIMRAPVTGGARIDPVKLALARQYRKEPTVQEAQVWEWVRNRRLEGLKFRRQQVIAGFIADYYCAEHRLALEIDGPGHETAAGKAYDEVREEIFAAMGIRTIRVSNNDCTEAYIRQRIRETPATQPSLPAASESIPLANSQTGESSPFSYSPCKERRSGEATSPSPFMERGPGGEVKEIWQPAAGVFEGWPQTARELKILDPCCGSGHFLVTAFRIMTALRMEEEGLSAREAGDAVLRDNLFGLEIDERCTQIAVFALALAAWTYPGAGGPPGAATLEPRLLRTGGGSQERRVAEVGRKR